MSGLDFSVKGLEEQQRRRRDDRRGRVGVAVAVVASLFALAGRSPTLPPASLAANPQRFDFGVQQVGTASATRTVTLTNTSTRNFTADYDPTAAGPHFVVTGCHSNAYKADATANSCTLNVTLRPGSAGPLQTRLTIFEMDERGARVGAALATIELTGHAERPPPARPAERPRVDPPPVEPPAPREPIPPPRDVKPPESPRLEVTPSVLDFSPPRPARQDVVVRNAGAGSLSIGGAGLAGGDSGAFRLDTDDCTAQPLAAGEQCTITVTRKLFAAASLAAELRIEHTAAGTPARVQLTRTPAPAATIRAEPDSLDFGSAVLGTQSTQRLTLVNIGSVAARSVSTGFIGNSDSFRLGQNGCGGTLAPQARCVVDVVFAPVKTGLLQSGLLITGMIVLVRGTGEAQAGVPSVLAAPRPTGDGR